MDVYILNKEGKVYLEKQIKVMRNGWIFYLPFAIILYTIAILDRWDENAVRHIIVATLTLGATLIYLFIVVPVRRVNVMSRIIKRLEIHGDTLMLTTYGVFWKKPMVYQMNKAQLQVLNHANDKGRNVYDLQETYRLQNSNTGTEFFLLSLFIENWEELHNRLTERCS